MSKDPKPSGSDPSENIPKLSKKQQETTEMDLWDLDGDEPIIEPKAEALSPRAKSLPDKKPSKTSVHSKKPIERTTEVPLLTDPIDYPEQKPAETPKKTESNKKLSKKETPKKVVAKERAPKDSDEDHELGDINDLDDAEVAKAKKAIKKPVKGEPKTAPPAAKAKAKAKKGIEKDDPAVQPESLAKADDTENVEAAPLAFTSFSKIEKISLISLVAILLIGGILSVVHFANRVPTRSTIAEEVDFPVTGERVTITGATTYWREPNRGENGDVVRRGTKLIPVLDLSLEAKKSAIRIFFRNDNGEVIGDGITRDVSGKTKLSIPATAGFDDIGMHAAYRTGESVAWVVQVYEGPNVNASREQFKKVLETEISTDRR
ncbi:MAG: hypothetical protein ABJQ29_05690 [Luteolibacter sp.]